MTVLSGQSIRLRSTMDTRTFEQDVNGKEWKPLIEPFAERTVFGGRSYGLSSAGYDIRIDKLDTPNIRDEGADWSYRMMPGDFLLASSMERIVMPPDLICIVHDKSSWARQGLAIQNTVLEPGWEGYITLELSFHAVHSYATIRKGDPIAQLIFHKLDHPTEMPYNGKYQNQENRPVATRFEL